MTLAETGFGTDLLTPDQACKWLETGAPPFADLAGMRCFQDFFGALGTSHQGAFDLTAWTIFKTQAREAFCTQIAYAVPCAEAIALIARSPRLVELGAGTGFWSALLARAGCDVLSCDPRHGVHDYVKKRGEFHPVADARGEDFIRHHLDRDVLICWPGINDEWTTNAVKRIRAGRSLYYVGERDGCTGTESLRHLLAKKFELIDICDIPQWEFLHDALFHYRRVV